MGVAQLPDFHVVFPPVEQVNIVGFQWAEAYFSEVKQLFQVFKISNEICIE